MYTYRYTYAQGSNYFFGSDQKKKKKLALSSNSQWVFRSAVSAPIEGWGQNTIHIFGKRFWPKYYRNAKK